MIGGADRVTEKVCHRGRESPNPQGHKTKNVVPGFQLQAWWKSLKGKRKKDQNRAKIAIFVDIKRRLKRTKTGIWKKGPKSQIPSKPNAGLRDQNCIIAELEITELSGACFRDNGGSCQPLYPQTYSSKRLLRSLEEKIKASNLSTIGREGPNSQRNLGTNQKRLLSDWKKTSGGGNLGKKNSPCQERRPLFLPLPRPRGGRGSGRDNWGIALKGFFLERRTRKSQSWRLGASSRLAFRVTALAWQDETLTIKVWKTDAARPGCGTKQDGVPVPWQQGNNLKPTEGSSERWGKPKTVLVLRGNHHGWIISQERQTIQKLSRNTYWKKEPLFPI